MPSLAVRYLCSKYRDDGYRIWKHVLVRDGNELLLRQLIQVFPDAAIMCMPFAAGQGHNLRALTLVLSHLAASSLPGAEHRLARGMIGQAMIAAVQRDRSDTLRCVMAASREFCAEEHQRRLDLALLVAAEKGHARCVMALLTGGANLDAQSESEHTALQLATDNGHTHVVRVLVSAHLELRPDLDMSWMFITAVDHDDMQLFRLLLEELECCPTTETLCAAIAEHRENIVALLMPPRWGQPVPARLAYVNLDDPSVTPDGVTPTVLAAKCGNARIVSMLLSHGAHLTRDDMTAAICAAVTNGHTMVVNVLLMHACANGVYEHVVAELGHILVVHAAEREDTALVKLLLRCGLTGTVEDVLLVACRRGDVSTLKLLIQDTTVDLTCRDNESLLLTCRGNHVAATRLLLQQGVDPLKPEPGRYLKEALRHASRRLMELLGHFGALQTPGFLVVAYADNGMSSSLHTLLASKRSQVLQEDLDLALLQASRQYTGPGSYHVIRQLLEHGADVHTANDAALSSACRFGYVDIVHLLISFGANIQARGGYNLFIACQNGHVDVVQALLMNDPDISEVYLNWALVAACRSQQHAVVQLLIDNAGADVNDYDGSCLHAACQRGDNALVTLLLQAGADAPRIENLFCCMRHGHLEILQTLLMHDSFQGRDEGTRHSTLRQVMRTALASDNLDAVKWLVDVMGVRVAVDDLLEALDNLDSYDLRDTSRSTVAYLCNNSQRGLLV